MRFYFLFRFCILCMVLGACQAITNTSRFYGMRKYPRIEGLGFVSTSKTASISVSLPSKKGHLVTFTCHKNEWSASVRETLPNGFSRIITLPIRCASGFSVNDFVGEKPEWQAQHLHIIFPKEDPRGQGFIYLGSLGLKGGMLSLDSNPYEEIHEALIVNCAKGDTEKLRSLLYMSKEVDINYKNTFGMTALGIACQNGQAVCINILKDHIKLDLNLPCKLYDPNLNGYKEGLSPLFISCYYNRPACVEALLKASDKGWNKQIHPNQENEIGNSPIHVVCERNYVACLQKLLEHPHTDSNKLNGKDKENERYTGLHIACQHGNTEIIKTLANDKEIKINLCCGPYEQSALDIACCYNKPAAIRALYTHKGLNVNITRLGGLSPLQICAQKGHTGCIKTLLEHPDLDPNQALEANKQSSLFLACYFGRSEVIAALLNDKYSRVKIDQSDILGRTPLYISCEKNHPEILEKLLPYTDSGLVNKPALSPEALTPLAAVCKLGYTDCFYALKNYPGLDLNACSGAFGQTALAIACAGNNVDTAKALLLEKDIDINKLGLDGANALHIACYTGHSDCVKELCAHPDINVDILHGRTQKTALMIAQENHHQPCVIALIQAKDRDEEKNNDGIEEVD